MIIDDLKSFHKYVILNEKFKKVFEFLKDNRLEDMAAGSYEIDGRDIFVNIDNYKTKEISLPEAHRKYIDIQIVLNGHEKIGYAPILQGKTEIQYDDEKDIEFLKAECEYIKAYSGRFFIFYPQDIHQPCITDETESDVKKAVFKIKI